jgi:hypothetical protein
MASSLRGLLLAVGALQASHPREGFFDSSGAEMSRDVVRLLDHLAGGPSV